MSDESNHELISAYLDGELPADQRARVERLLADDAQCRQVYDELRALRVSLSALPRQRLDKDLAAEVLRRAENAKLEQQSAARLTPAAADDQRDRASRAWRLVIYPLLALAAAIAVMVSSPENKKQPQLAHGPVRPAPPAQMSAPADGYAEHMDRSLHEPAGRDAKADSSAEADSDAMSAGDADSIQLFDKATPAEVSGPATADSEAADGPATGRFEYRASGSAAKARARTESAGFGRRAAASSQLGAAGGLPPGLKATLVLQCTLAPAAVRAKEFEKLLARNHLKPLSVIAASDANANSFSKKEGDLAQLQSQNNNYKVNGESPSAVATPVGSSSFMLGGMGDALAAGGVMVEMNPEQLAAVLADLQSHPDEFVQVELAGQARVARADKKLPQAEAETIDSLAKDETAGESAAADATQSSATRHSAAVELGEIDEKPAAATPERLLVLFRLSEAAGK